MFAFRNLQILCSYKELGINMNPVFIMCDFESALRKALNQCFINAKLAGCYFHYCKALWNYMASHSLTTKERLPNSIKLVTFLKILAHIPIEERVEVFEEICSAFKKQDSKYKEMIDYFERNWLKSYYVESMAPEEENNTSLISRTNNICEFYNHILNQKIGIVSPRLSILVSHLIDEEMQIREYLTKVSVYTSAITLLPQGFTVKEDQLPIGSLTKLLQEKKTSGYNLRSVIKEKEFETECKRLVSRCYEALFLASEDSQDIIEEVDERKEKDQEEEREENFNENYRDLNNIFVILEKEKDEIENPSIETEDERKLPFKSSKRLKFSF